ncbi:hypothetical protein ACFL5W_00015 [Thermodesulfobacteriota bacterium]
MRKMKPELFWSCVGTLFLCLLVLSPALSIAPLAAEATPDCDIHTQSCQKVIGNRTVELDIDPKPVTAMKDLTFRVTISGEPLDQAPYIDLGMPGMHMGPNQVKLENTGAATYEGKGVIVRCKSGKRIWRATITLPGIGKTDFTFDVIY